MIRSALLPLVLLAGLAASAQDPQGLTRKHLVVTIKNKSERNYELLSALAPVNPALPRPMVTRLGIAKAEGAREDFMAMDIPARGTRELTLVLEYKLHRGQTDLDLGFQLKDGRKDTALWAFTAQGAKLTASECAGERKLDPGVVRIEGPVVTIERGLLGR